MSDKPGDPADRTSHAEGQDQFQSNHRAGYGTESARLLRLIDWIRRHPHCTLASGEGALLLKYITELEAALAESRKTD